MARFPTIAVVFSLLLTSSAVVHAGVPQRWLVRATTEDAQLRRHPEKLRFRHHILHVIRLWQTAVKKTDGQDRLDALEGEAGAWALLAHWSGRTSDAHRAHQARRRWDEAVAEATETRPTIELSDCSGSDLPVVMLDPGHGGDEEGSHNVDGVAEKDVNLALAFQVARLIQTACPMLTRIDDRHVSLADRVRQANASSAELFISIHANGSVHRRFHGVETYVLDVEGERYESRLEQREGPDAIPSDPNLKRDLRMLLADLAMRSATRRSRHMADLIQGSLLDRIAAYGVTPRDLGTKGALFYVLLGVRMPSVLIETGFMTHPEEGRRLAEPDYQSALAEGIAVGIDSYIGAKKRPATGARAVVAQVR